MPPTKKTAQTSDSSEGFSEDLIKNVCKQQTEDILKSLNPKFENLQKSIENFGKRIESNERKIEQVDLRIEEMEQQNKLNNLIIYGVNENCNENVEELLITLFKNKLDVEIHGNEIENCYRLGADNTGKYCRPIHVKFLSSKVRNLVYKNKKQLKKTKIVIREDLTKKNQQIVKYAINKYGKNAVYTQSCKIYVLENNLKRQLKEMDE